MATRYYITFHSSTYDTTKRYSSCLQILSKDNLVVIGQDIALKIPMSWSKEKMADYMSSYVVSHPEEMVSILDDEEIVLAHDIIGEACRKHERWFDSYWCGGVQTSVVLFLDVLRHLYCHLRQHPDIPWQTKEAMDFHLLLTNKHHRLFGDLELSWGDSRMDDMLNDDSPYCDYSNMEDELYGYLERMIG